jgi:hypothetical protein
MIRKLSLAFLIITTSSVAMKEEFDFPPIQALLGAQGNMGESIDKLDGVVNKGITTASEAILHTTQGLIDIFKKEATQGFFAATALIITAGPYIAGGAAFATIGYGSYRWYKSRKPSKEKFKQQLESCLYKNQNGPFNKHRVPEKCSAVFKNYSIFAGYTKAHDKVAGFNEL